MDYLVTGATGLVGNNLVRQILERGGTVRALVRSEGVPDCLAGLAVETARGDIRDAESVERAARGVRCVLHAAADTHIGWHHLERQRQINVTGSRNVGLAARAAGARMIHVSSVDALPDSLDGRPVDEETPDRCKVPCTYVVTKREAEQAVRALMQDGLDAVIVNPGFMLGPWDWKPSSGRMLLAIARVRIPAAPRGGMSGCDVRDVASGILNAATRGRPGHRYILAGENISYFDAWRMFARIVGHPPGPSYLIPSWINGLSGRLGDLWARVSGNETDVNSAMIQMSQRFHYYCSDRARRELGYQPRPFEESARDAWEWLRAREFPTPHSKPSP
jgi:dihydroflavonol-4-reductase